MCPTIWNLVSMDSLQNSESGGPVFDRIGILGWMRDANPKVGMHKFCAGQRRIISKRATHFSFEL